MCEQSKQPAAPCRHPHYEVIVAWAEGKPIQRWFSGKGPNGMWQDVSPTCAPAFGVDGRYRIKPTPRTAYQVYMDAARPEHAPWPNMASSTAEAGFAAIINAVKSGELG